MPKTKSTPNRNNPAVDKAVAEVHARLAELKARAEAKVEAKRAAAEPTKHAATDLTPEEVEETRDAYKANSILSNWRDGQKLPYISAERYPHLVGLLEVVQELTGRGDVAKLLFEALLDTFTRPHKVLPDIDDAASEPEAARSEESLSGYTAVVYTHLTSYVWVEVMECIGRYGELHFERLDEEYPPKGDDGDDAWSRFQDKWKDGILSSECLLQHMYSLTLQFIFCFFETAKGDDGDGEDTLMSFVENQKMLVALRSLSNLFAMPSGEDTENLHACLRKVKTGVVDFQTWLADPRLGFKVAAPRDILEKAQLALAAFHSISNTADLTGAYKTVVRGKEYENDIWVDCHGWNTKNTPEADALIAGLVCDIVGMAKWVCDLLHLDIPSDEVVASLEGLLAEAIFNHLDHMVSTAVAAFVPPGPANGTAKVEDVDPKKLGRIMNNCMPAVRDLPYPEDAPHEEENADVLAMIHNLQETIEEVGHSPFALNDPQDADAVVDFLTSSVQEAGDVVAHGVEDPDWDCIVPDDEPIEVCKPPCEDAIARAARKRKYDSLTDN